MGMENMSDGCDDRAEIGDTSPSDRAEEAMSLLPTGLDETTAARPLTLDEVFEHLDAMGMVPENFQLESLAQTFVLSNMLRDKKHE